MMLLLLFQLMRVSLQLTVGVGVGSAIVSHRLLPRCAVYLRWSMQSPERRAGLPGHQWRYRRDA